MAYLVQKGDTIGKVTKLLGMSWTEVRQLNAQAVGRSSRTGRWFLKEGAIIQTEKNFQNALKSEEKRLARGTDEQKTDPASERWAVYTIKPGDTLWGLAVRRFHVHVEDLIRDNGIEDPRQLRVGQEIRVRIPSLPEERQVIASWYGKAHHGKPMANGEPFNMYKKTVAHRDLPLGTRVELENPSTGERATAVVTDRGPYVEGRDLDLSYALAERLSLTEKGVGRLVMRVLG